MSSTEWFSKARFGMMLHWGLYSLLAGEYRGEQMGGADNGSGELGEWAQTYFRIPCREYEKLAEAFNPVGFDAEECTPCQRSGYELYCAHQQTS